MEKYELEKLRDLPIEEVAEQLGLQVDAHHKALCPFHSDHHASLSFHRAKNTCRCFVCMEKSLGTIDLVMKLKHIDFLAACHWLADRFVIDIKGRKPEWGYSKNTARKDVAPTNADRKGDVQNNADPPTAPQAPKPFDAGRYARIFEHPWLGREARRFLFEERRLDERVVSWCRLSSWQDRDGTHWLQTPYFDVGGRLIGIQSRNLDYPPKTASGGKPIADPKATGGGKPIADPKAAGKPRFRFPPGAKCSIYNLPVVGMLKPGDELYITEGCSDCWAMLSSGRKAMAIPSATLLTPADKLLLADLDRRLAIRWHMYPDRDAPGERLFLQLKQLLPGIEHHQLPPGCKDFAECYLLKVKNEK